MLEYFVEAELAKSLHGVAKERWCPALPQPTYTRLPQGHTESVDDAPVLARIDLDAAFDQIQRYHGRVCYPTAQDATKATESIVLAGAIFTAVAFSIYNVQTVTGIIISHQLKYSHTSTTAIMNKYFNIFSPLYLLLKTSKMTLCYC